VQVAHATNVRALVQEQAEGCDVTHASAEVTKVEASDDLKRCGYPVLQEMLRDPSFDEWADDPNARTVCTESVIQLLVPAGIDEAKIHGNLSQRSVTISLVPLDGPHRAPRGCRGLSDSRALSFRDSRSLNVLERPSAVVLPFDATICIPAEH